MPGLRALLPDAPRWSWAALGTVIAGVVGALLFPVAWQVTALLPPLTFLPIFGMAQLALGADACPVVQSVADRTQKFPSPLPNQQVFNKATGNIERFDPAVGWLTSVFGVGPTGFGMPGYTNTITTGVYARGTSGNVANDNAVAVNAAVAAAPGLGATMVWVVAAHLPYTASLVTFNPTIQMIREGAPQVNVFDLLAYGGSGDGVSNNDAAWTAVLAAVNQISGGGGGVIDVPVGTWNFATGIAAGFPYVIQGRNTRATVLNYTGSGTAFTFNWASSAHRDYGTGLRQLTLSGPSRAGATTGVQLAAATGVGEGAFFQNINVNGFGTGVKWGGNFLAWVVEWDHCSILNNGKNLNITPGAAGIENIYFHCCTFGDDTGWDAAGNNIQITNGSGDITFEACSFDNAPLTITSGQISILGGHFENPTFSATTPYITTAGQLNLTGVAFLQDAVGGGPTSFVAGSAGAVAAFGCSYSNNGGAPAMATVYALSGSVNLSDVGMRVMQNISLQWNGSTTGVILALGGNPFGTFNQGPYLRGAPVQMNGVDDAYVALTWGASVALNAAAGTFQSLTAISNIAAVIAAPTNTPGGNYGRDMTIEIFNNSGGALTTAPTFAAGAGAWLLTAAAVNPANGQSVLYRFKWSQIRGRFMEVSRTVAF